MEQVLDGKGTKIEVGARIICAAIGGGLPGPDDLGTVTRITEIDLDAPPRVCVTFDDGTEDTFGTDRHVRGWCDYVDALNGDIPFTCDDVTVVPETLAERLERLDPDGQDAS